MRYTQEFKTKVINEVQEIGSITTVSKKHNIPMTTLHGWIKKGGPKVETISNLKNKNLKSEVKILKNKLDDAELELMILKDLLKKTYQH